MIKIPEPPQEWVVYRGKAAGSCHRLLEAACYLHVAGIRIAQTQRPIFSPGVVGATRSVWSTGLEPPSASDLNPLSSLTSDEISAAAGAVKAHYKVSDQECSTLRFVVIALAEPNKAVLRSSVKPPREAEVIILNNETGIATELKVFLDDNASASVTAVKDLERGVLPLLTPDGCDLAEALSESSPELQAALKEHYGIPDMSKIAADPWSVFMASDEDVADPSFPARRLVQTFL